MDFYFTDRKFNLLGVASTSGTTEISLANEEDKLSIEDSVRTLTGSLFYSPESRAQAEAMSSLGNYVLYKDESGRSVWTTIMEINNDPLAGECIFTSEDAGVDLINELVGPYTADKAYTIASYINRFTADSGFKIGINEISDLSRKLEWESEDATALARILSVATQFDNAELEFRFEVNGLQVVERYIDIFKKRGTDERVTLYVDKDINRIVTSGNIYDLGTSLKGTGGTPEGKDAPITLKGYKYTDKDGRYVLGSDGIMRDTVAVQKWSRLLNNDNPEPTSSHIQRLKKYETTDQKTLCDNVLRDLKQMAEVELNYEAEIVSLPYGVKIGDTIYLVDEEGELYLSARVLELTRCYSEDLYVATLGNYLIKDSGIDVDLQALADKLKDQVKPGDTYYPWTRYADDDQGNGMSALPDGKTYMATIHRKNDPIPSDNKDDYAGAWVKIKGDDGTDGEPGKDGEKGDKGDPGSDGLPGKDGVGVSSTTIQYAQSTSGSTAPTSGWTSSVPTLVKGRYLWTKTVWTYTDGTNETGYTVSYNAKDGNTGKDGIAGKDGVGITNTVIEYVGAVSGTSKPTSGWSTTIPSVPAGQYLWTRTTWSYSDGTSEQGYSTALMGKTGASGKDGVAGKDGVGIKSTQIMYAGSDSGTTAPTSGWTTSVPTLIKGRYLWTRTIWTYTDNSTETGYTVSYNAKDGNNGTDGIAGKDGVGITSTLVEYAKSTSGTTKPTTGWSTTIPTVPAGQYLWTRTTWSYTDSTAEQGFSVAKMGDTGSKGDDGADGIGIANTKTDYQLHTSATTPPTGTWATSPPAVTVGKYLWTRTILEYTDGTKATPAYSVSGGPGANGSDGKDGQDGAPGADALPIFSGYVTNEAIVLSATNSGAVSDFSKATGNFVTYIGQTKLTSGVTYSRVSQTSVTATINATTGAYSVTAASADTGMVVFKAVYQGIEIQKMVSVTKAKQGNTGATGAKGADGEDGANGTPGAKGADGKSSYLHVGWKMADGTFTTAYPQENMFNRTNGHVYSPHPLNASLIVVALPATVGAKYTASCNYEYTSTTSNTWFIHALDVLPSSNTHSIGIMAGTPTSRTVTATGPNVYLVFRNIGALSHFVDSPWAHIIKVELGSTATLITPAPQDDYTAAYPKYRGEYTDNVQADSTDPDRYTWTAYLGEQGPPTGVISQNTVPSAPYIGMLWQNTGNVSGYISNATYRWNGSAWTIYQFTAQNILAETFTGFVFQGVEFIGSRFVSEFDIPLGGDTTAHSQGTTTIADGKMVTDAVQYYPDAGGILQASYDQHLEYSPQNGVYMSLKGRRSDIAQEAQLTPGGLRIKTEVAEAVLSVDTIYSLVCPATVTVSPSNDANRKNVNLIYYRVGNLVSLGIKFELLKDTGWVSLAPVPPSGYTPYSGTQATAVAGSLSYRGQSCLVYYNSEGFRLIPTTGQGTGTFQAGITYVTNDPFPYGDS